MPKINDANRPRSTVLPALLVCSCVFLRGQTVGVQAGNVYFEDAAGRARQITSNGLDSDAALSPDGRYVVFIRKTTVPCGFDEPLSANPVRTQVWEASLDPIAAPRVVFAGIVHASQHSYCSFSRPQLTSDNTHAYFLIGLSATENAIVRLNLRTGTAEEMSRVFGGVILYHVVSAGPYRNDLVVQKKHYLPAGVSQLFWLVDPEGKELGYVGETEADAQAFLKNPYRRLPTAP